MTKTNKIKPVASSFRDPSGALFLKEGRLYRTVNNSYKADYEYFMSSGLYDKLVSGNLLVRHEEVSTPDFESLEYRESYKIIEPQQIPFISYPYEWCFGQLKAAALTTLEIQKVALEFGMVLKDSSAYNIQFVNCRSMLIDTLSFEIYVKDQPWVAYRQFCQHFLAPLNLMSYNDIQLGQLLKMHIDGLPLDFVSRLLPFRTRLRFALLSHIHLHSKAQKMYAGKSTITNGKLSRGSLLALIENLQKSVEKLKWQPISTAWSEYYVDTIYPQASFNKKREIVSQYLDVISPRMVWDFGSNTGQFSRMASRRGIETISFDYDSSCVEINFTECLKNEETNLFPLLMDLTNPSPSIGWAHSERMSLAERGPADLILALALIHHLAISNNVPLEKIAALFASISKSLIIEVVPKDDIQVKRLLTSRRDIFQKYTITDFESAFSKWFTIVRSDSIPKTNRMLYFMKAAIRL